MHVLADNGGRFDQDFTLSRSRALHLGGIYGVRIRPAIAGHVTRVK
jgi:hypothetical protein